MNTKTIVNVIVTVFVSSNGTASTIRQTTSTPGQYGVVSGYVTTLLNAYTTSALQRRLDTWSEYPSYSKLSILDALADQMLINGVCETFEYKWQTPGHDFNSGAGRAAWAIEKLLRVEVMQITPQSSPAEIGESHAEATLFIELYRDGVISAGREYGSEKTTTELKATYSERIVLGITGSNAYSSMSAMDELLAEWFPLEKPLAELVDIIGEGGEVTDYGVVFSFDTGYVGRRYHFFVDRGLIQSVVLR